MLQKYFFELWMKGMTVQEAEHVLPTTLREALSVRIHILYYRDAAGGYDQIPDSEIQKDLAIFREFFALPLEEKLHLYPLRYAVFPVDASVTDAMRQVQARSRRVYKDDAYEVWDLDVR